MDGTFAITDNASLPTCEAERLRDLIGVDNIGQALEIHGNDDGGVCP